MATAMKLVFLCLVACVLTAQGASTRAQPSRAQPSRAQPSSAQPSSAQPSGAQPSMEHQLRALQANGSDVLTGIVNVLADSANAMRGALSADQRHKHAPIEWSRQDELMTLTPSADQALVIRFYVMPYVMDFVEHVLASGVQYNEFGYQRFVEEPEWLLKYHLSPLDFHAARRACADEGARLYHGHAHTVELDTRMAVFYPTLQPWFGEEKESTDGPNHCNYLTYIEGVVQKWDKCSRPHPYICERRLSDDYQPLDASAPTEPSPWPAPPCLNPPDCLDPPPPPSGSEPQQCFVPPCPEIVPASPVVAEVDDGSLEPKPFPLPHSEASVDRKPIAHRDATSQLKPSTVPQSEVAKPFPLPPSEVPVEPKPVAHRDASTEPKPSPVPQSEVAKPSPLPPSEVPVEPKPVAHRDTNTEPKPSTVPQPEIPKPVEVPVDAKPLPELKPAHDHVDHDGHDGHEYHHKPPSPELIEKVDEELTDIIQLAASVQELLDVVSSPGSTGIRTSMAKRQRPILLMRKILGVTQTDHAQIRARLDALSPAQRASLSKAVRAHTEVIAQWNTDRELLNRYVEKVSGKQQLIIPELNLLLAKLSPLKAKQ